MTDHANLPSGQLASCQHPGRSGQGRAGPALISPMSALISAAELGKLIGDDDLVIIDVRWTLGGPPGRDEFDAGHIPAAHYVDLDDELAAAPGDGGRHPLPAGDDVGETLRRCGVHADTHVVVYDEKMSMSAARAWWVFRNVGVARISVLDGGLAAWIAGGGALETGPQDPAAGTFEPSAPRLAQVDAEAAAWIAENGVLLDARAPERFRGEVEPIDPVAGHIPGAVSAPTTDNLNEDGTFLDRTSLQERFAALGIDDETVVGCYCGSGVTAAHQLLALEEAGIDGTLYPGSWSEWVRDPSRPVATGDGSST